jgi:hypothetical protein
MTRHEAFFRETSKGKRVLKITGFVILGALAAAFFALLFGYIVMLLWNWLMPEIFSLGMITFWQAVGLILLARLIFGGFKHGGDEHKSFTKKKFARPDFEKGRNFESFWKDQGKSAYERYCNERGHNESEETPIENP